jgi:multidrug efflux pump subunit AcrA (membrane-fusion protein)
VNVLVTKDGKTSQETRSIKTGSTDGINTEVREGLKEGEIVILAGGDTPKRPGGGGAANPFGPAGGGAGGGGRGGGGGGGGGRGR